MESFQVTTIKAVPGRVTVSTLSNQRSSCMRFSMGSATRSCISWAVAPGHMAVTVRTLTVKAGSSARPSLTKE